jgi:hypothetical protein
MPATFMVSEDSSYVIGRVIGQHTGAMQRPVMDELFSLIVATGVRRALVDAREQQRPISTLEIYDLWEEMAPRIPRGVKFAVVVGWQISGRPFIEDVAVNRGVTIRYFNDMEQALRWLRGA